jgi:hypothetical protein
MAKRKKTEDEMLEKIKELENKIDSQKTESLRSNEDQLFFGVIISLLVLFVTLPITDISSFLESVFKVNQDIALTDAGYIKYVGIIAFLVSTLTRYCAVVSELDVSKKFRYASFEALWLGLNIIILTITINLFTTLSPQFGLLGLTITFLILTLIFLGMLLLEGYILKIYVSKELILKKHSFPYASLVLLSTVLGIEIAYVVEIFAMIFGVPFSIPRFLLVYIIVEALIISLSLIKRNLVKLKQDYES